MVVHRTKSCKYATDKMITTYGNLEGKLSETQQYYKHISKSVDLFPAGLKRQNYITALWALRQLLSWRLLSIKESMHRKAMAKVAV